jgi:hypothetical protein
MIVGYVGACRMGAVTDCFSTDDVGSINMKPSDYKNYYEQCAVTLPDGKTETVAVRKYLLKDTFLGEKTTRTNKETLKAFENKLFDHRKFDIDLRVNLVPVKSSTPTGTQVVRGGTLSFQQVHSVVQSAFSGKGSPEACQVVLQLAHQWDLAKKGLQEYAGELGIDCTGFVGNYLWHVIHKKDWTETGTSDKDRDGPGQGISHYLAGRRPITDWGQLAPGTSYILGRASDKPGHSIIDYREGSDPGHIVITDPDRFHFAGKAISELGTVESTASADPPGLSAGYYSFVSASKDVFLVSRGNVPGSYHKQLYFKIVQAPPPDPD